ncbi:MAG: rhodanese-like domain-containing protein [Alphaproteobacteria bacterium]|nr:rhodanese-like domain-containing protein [Alphaproteobacteria bacterium]
MWIYLRSLILGVSLVTGLPFAALQHASANEAAAQVGAPSISPRDLQSLVTKKDSFLLYDVRQPEEYNEGHIKNAVLMPLSDVPNRYKELPKDKKIVVYCRSGRRSAEAVSFLREKGYTNVINLSGGYQEWAEIQKAEAKKPNSCSGTSGC